MTRYKRNLLQKNLFLRPEFWRNVSSWDLLQLIFWNDATSCNCLRPVSTDTEINQLFHAWPGLIPLGLDHRINNHKILQTCDQCHLVNTMVPLSLGPHCDCCGCCNYHETMTLGFFQPYLKKSKQVICFKQPPKIYLPPLAAIYATGANAATATISLRRPGQCFQSQALVTEVWSHL